MDQTIKAIETVYKGYRFRSRLEARWAVFYDALGIEWEYEKEGFEFWDGSRYLPDFYLKDYGWIEIKGIEPTQEEKRLANFLGQVTGRPVYIFFGSIPEPGSLGYFRDDGLSAYIIYPNWDVMFEWCRCQSCGKLGIQFEGRTSRICKHTSDDHGMLWDDPVINAAYQKARSARFEHGERP